LKEIHCEHCSTRQHANGQITYSHTVLTPVVLKPSCKEVIPLAPEFILPQDGAVKQDCELNAGKRWLHRYQKEFGRHKVTLLGDDLYSHEPFCRDALAHGFDFIYVCKKSSHTTLYEWLDYLQGGDGIRTVTRTRWTGKRHETDTYRYAQSVPLRDGKAALHVQWFELVLTQAINQYQSQPQLLQELLNKQQTDALVVVSSQANEIQWRIFSTDTNIKGKINADGLVYLPHIWAEHLAMSWQWPELKNGILFRINNVSQLEQFIDVENALQTACSQLKVLHVVGTQANFACLSTQSYTHIANQLRLIPQLAHVPFLHPELAPNVLIGQKLAQRYLHYQWLTDSY
jgi:hypothetical protein